MMEIEKVGGHIAMLPDSCVELQLVVGGFSYLTTVFTAALP